MNRLFIYSELFERALKQRKKQDEILESIEGAILENPIVGAVIAGTGGVRKFRSEDSERSKGKRGGFRVLYLDLPRKETTHLLFLYNKNEADNISAAGKKLIKSIVEDIKGEKS